VAEHLPSIQGPEFKSQYWGGKTGSMGLKKWEWGVVDNGAQLSTGSVIVRTRKPPALSYYKQASLKEGTFGML
jgi:hypothetical protein